MAAPKFKLWPDPPEGSGLPYGPQPKQKLLFIEELPDAKPGMSEEEIAYCRPHYHPLDIVLFIGAGRSGKTTSAAARVIKFLFQNPKSIAIVGAENLKLLTRTAKKEWRDRFSINEEWDHLKLENRLITRKPTMNDERVTFTNGSEAYFMYFSKPGQLKGINAAIVHYEEADLMPDAGAFEELCARMSSSKSPQRQIILTTNPVKARKGWINQKFKLYQLDPSFKGKREPICDPCTCQYCPKCREAGLGDWVYKDKQGNTSTSKFSQCSNTECPWIEITTQKIPGQPVKKGFAFIKDSDCPGNQVFMRVIETKSSDNPHKPSDYEESASAGMSKKTARAMIGGSIEQDHEGEVYLNFGPANVNYNPTELDLTKDLVWSMDQDEDPHSSVILQETITKDSIRVDVLDEIFEWDAPAEYAAKLFCAKYHGFKDSGQVVQIYSDPAALFGQTKRKDCFYTKIIKYLKSPTDETGEIVRDALGRLDFVNGKAFRVQMMMKRDMNPNYRDKNREKLKINVDQKVQCTNDMLRNVEGESRIFINYTCQQLISSLSSVKWVPGTNSINKNIDKIAKNNQESMSPTTHPSDALGYYCAKRFPLIKDKKGIVIVMDHEGNNQTVYHNGKSYQKDKLTHKFEEEAIKHKMDKKKEREARREAARRKAQRRDAKGFMQAWGLRARDIKSTFFN